MKQHKELWATLGLLFITFLAAIQYVFLRNVPAEVPSFAFVCITNVIGMVILGVLQLKRILRMRGKTLKKGVILACELTVMNFFILLGSRHLDAVIISSTVSLYFVFITPILLLLRRKINFFSGVATVIAILALLLMFGADLESNPQDNRSNIFAQYHGLKGIVIDKNIDWGKYGEENEW